MSSPTSGGFVRPGVLSPPATSTASCSTVPPLPQPRAHPLKFGSSKESTFIRYMDEGVNKIQRRFAKRTATMGPDAPGDAKGYESFKEVAVDIEQLVDVAWISGTPDTISGFPPSPRAMFRLIHKLDIAFSSLMQGRDPQTGEVLPGFSSGRKVNATEKVRIKSLVERSRIIVVEVMSSGEFDGADDEEDGNTTADQSMDESAEDADPTDIEDEDTGWDMEIAKAYDKTIVELGDTIGGSPIGIVTDN